MINIDVDASEIWDYFNENKFTLGSGLMDLLASNYDYNLGIDIEIYLSECDGNPKIVVMKDEEVIYEEVMEDEDECIERGYKIYDKYLELGDQFDKKETLSEEDKLEIIDERESELDDALYNLLETIVPDVSDNVENINDIIDHLKDYICEWLFKEQDVSVYRPMYLENENGDKEFVEFPYPEIEFEN